MPRLHPLLGMLLMVGAAGAVAQRLHTPLDGSWRFQRADVPQAAQPAFDDSGWAGVTLPHTWNAVDGEAGGGYHRDAAWYRRDIERPARPAPGRRQFLEFDAATMAADVWLNGQHAGRHEGGYSRFRLDITPLLRPGRNVLAVRVDNGSALPVVPLGGDFTVFGGLIRPVRLIDTDAAHLELLDHGGPGVQVDTKLAGHGATLAVRVDLRNDGRAPADRTLRLTLRDAAGRVVARSHERLRLAAGAAHGARATLQVDRPRLWQGVHDPYLHRLSVELMRGTTVADAVHLPLGLREFSADPQRGFLLNGQPYPLHGVNYFHPGRPGRGVAVGDAQIDEDLRILTELGVSGLRLVHYPHPPRVYERADELGLVLWTEVPLNAAMQETPAFRANLFQQLRELVRQHRHHASVAVWGLGNEVYRSDEPIRALLAELHALAKQEDPARLTAYAHCCAPDDHPMALVADLAAYNRYWGWYDGEFTDIGRWADALHAKLPGKAIGLGEYGAGASALQQQDPPVRPEPGGRWHPEQYQALFHEAYARQIAARPYLWGHFVWLGFDHASAGRNEGDKAGVNDKGLVTYDRRLRKDAYHLLRAWWQREPVLHLASRRLSRRPAGPTTIKAYSNARELTLDVNGQRVGTVPVVDRVATWPAVPLAAGRAVLTVRDDRGLDDRVEWQIEPATLGTHRVLTLPRDGAAYGREQHGPLPLGPKEVVLTFDDGPSPLTTPQVLRALKAEGVRATFFVNGEPLQAHPALARQLQAEGHGVAMHGFRHVAFGELPPQDQRADLQALQQALRGVLGTEPAAWRFPYLAESPHLNAELRRQGISVLSTDVGLSDWLPGQTPEILAERLITGLRQRGGGIVLMHDTQPQTATALPLLLRRLREDGWRVVHLQWAAAPPPAATP